MRVCIFFVLQIALHVFLLFRLSKFTGGFICGLEVVSCPAELPCVEAHINMQMYEEWDTIFFNFDIPIPSKLKF